MLKKTIIPDISFILGVVIAVVAAIGVTLNKMWATSSWVIVILIVIGGVVGFYKIRAKEISPFLVGTVTLIIAKEAARLGSLNTLFDPLGTFIVQGLDYLIVVIAAAAVVVAFRAVYKMAR